MVRNGDLAAQLESRTIWQPTTWTTPWVERPRGIPPLPIPAGLFSPFQRVPPTVAGAFIFANASRQKALKLNTCLYNGMRFEHFGYFPWCFTLSHENTSYPMPCCTHVSPLGSFRLYHVFTPFAAQSRGHASFGTWRQSSTKNQRVGLWISSCWILLEKMKLTSDGVGQTVSFT